MIKNFQYFLEILGIVFSYMFTFLAIGIIIICAVDGITARAIKNKIK